MLQSIIFITPEPDPDKRLTQFQETRLHEFKTNSTDTNIITTETSVGIEEIRGIKHFISTKPVVSEFKTVVILQAELLTTEAQNALLKTLEEPGTSLKIILIAPHTRSFLPTIISRCQVIASKVKNTTQPDPSITNLLNDLKSASIGERVTLSDNYKDRQAALELTSGLTNLLRQKMLSTPNKQTLYNLTLTLYTSKILGQNANVKLALDNLFIYLKL